MSASSPSAATGLLLAAVSATGFGLLGVFGKHLFADGLGVGHVLMLRFVIATTCLWVFLGLRARMELRRISPRRATACVLLGVFGYAGQATLYFTALRELKSGLAAILLYLYPAVVALLVTLSTRRPPTRDQAVAMVLAMVGCGLVVDLSDSTISGLGIAAGVGSAVWYAAYLLGSERVLGGVRPDVASGLVFIGAAFSFTIGALALEPPTWPSDYRGWLFVTAMAVVSTVVPVVTLFIAIKIVGTLRASIVSTLEPVVTIVAGFLLLDERLSSLQLVGIGLILGGLLWLRLRDMSRARAVLANAGLETHP